MISYFEYVDMGFLTVPEQEFSRFRAMAVSAIKKLTSGRVGEQLSKTQKYGLCELIDMFYADEKAEGGSLTGFTNEGYSERYAENESVQTTALEKAQDIVGLYFDKKLCWRGV